MKKSFLFLLLSWLHLILFSQTKKEITLEDIWLKGTFKMNSVQGLTSMNDGIHYTTLDYVKQYTCITKHEYANEKKVDTLLKSSVLIPEGEKEAINIDEYEFSPDETKVLIYTDIEPIYRHSTKGNYYIWDFKNEKLTKVSTGDKQMYATFSPDGKNVAFILNNNLFIKDLTKDKETQITFDGERNSIINGATDWVYEEEFAFDRAYCWSPDGNKIGYYRFDESEVKEFAMTEYGTLYPTEYKFKYPKAGEANSKITIHIYDINSKKRVSADIGSETDQYIPRIQWTKDANTLSILRMNRHQNKLELLFTDATTGASKIIYTEQSDTYVDIHEQTGDFGYFLKDKKHFIIMSERGGYNHIYMYDIQGKLIKQITQGEWEVEKISGIDEKNKIIYYISTEESPMNKSIYSVKLDGTGKKKISSQKGCNNPSFSSGCNYYINNYSDANTPSVTGVYLPVGKLIRVLEGNNGLKTSIANYVISKKEFFTFKTSEGIELNGWMIKPADFNPSVKYPVFMTVYGGPGSNTVNDEWDNRNFLWHQMLAQKGYIIVSVDNRGTGGRGKDFKNCTYKQLGKLETTDQAEAAKYLGGISYIDKTRIGIFGWSYGGYMSSLCLLKESDYFKMAIAVAPVTNWRFYDSIYTERFMQTPDENPDGYDNNSPINYVKKLKGKYLLIHGTADDNVHFQNSIEMINALVKANKQFDLFIYPDKNHSIAGGNARFHLYTKMTNFIFENL